MTTFSRASADFLQDGGFLCNVYPCGAELPDVSRNWPRSVQENHTMSDRSIGLALAGAIGTAIVMSTTIGAQAQDASADKEKCYGIALAGKNDCAASGNNSCAGTSKINHDKGAWKYVTKGTCLSTEVDLKDGSKRKGSLQPVKG
jgi:uncharacterized membrane protein